MDVPETRYAKSGNVHIAYCIRGDGPVDLVFIPGWVSNIELMWEDRWMRAWLDRLATFSRLIAFDKRGTGLSDRVPDDRLPDLETRMDDVRAVMDAAGSQRAFLLGHSEGGLLAALFATTYPARTAGVVFFSSDVRGAWAPDHPWGTTREEFERELEAVERGWGNGAFARSMAADLAPSLAKDEDFLAWVVRYFRQSASPSAAIAIDRMWFETDARPIVRSLGVPSLVLWRRDAAYAAESRYLAEHVPGTIAVELPGSDHVPWIGDVDRTVDEIEAFISAVKDEDAVLDRMLATVLFTDIVGSTERARELGDRVWGSCWRHTTRGSGPNWRGSGAARSTPRVTGFWRPSMGPPAASVVPRRSRARSEVSGSPCAPGSIRGNSSSQTGTSAGSPFTWAPACAASLGRMRCW